MIKYECDTCGKLIDKDHVMIIEIKRHDRSTMIEKHLCLDHYNELCRMNHWELPVDYTQDQSDLSKSADSELSSQSSDDILESLEQAIIENDENIEGKETKPEFVNSRKPRNLMKSVIMIHRKLMTDKRSADYVQVPIATYNLYKKKYYNACVERRIKSADSYNQYLLNTRCSCSKLLTLYCGQWSIAKISDELNLEPIKIHALICFFTNIVPREWFSSIEQIVYVLTKINPKFATEFAYKQKKENKEENTDEDI